MTSNVNFAAVDLGAESGRVMLGTFNGKKLSLSEVHRFASAPVRLPGGLHTDVLHIWAEVKNGLSLAARKCGGSIAGIGVDTWGVDFALLDRQGGLVGNPYHYRNGPGPEIFDEAFNIVPRAEIFEQTGIQFMPINTLFQLLSLKLRESPMLDAAERLLMTPDLFNYWLSGTKVSEFSIATTSQCYDPRKGDWARPLLEKLALPSRIFSPVVAPGTVLGQLMPYVSEEVGIKKASIVAPACHDTALAVAAIPAKGDDFVYLSSGTWSLMGAELNAPCINEQSLAANYTNEGGVGGTYRFLKNITGLWLMQECRHEWARRGEEHSYDELTKMAQTAKPLQFLVDVDEADFAHPGDMCCRIQAYCKKTNQKAPETKAEIARCILENLALKYRYTFETLERILGRRFNTLHIVGGGSRNELLCQFATDATNRTVVTGPVEATAAGNVLMQALALGHLKSISELREVVRNSFDVKTYSPSNTAAWDDAYGRYLGILGSVQK